MGGVSATGEVTVDLLESNGSLPPGLWLWSPLVWLPRTGISSRTYACFEYGTTLRLHLSGGVWCLANNAIVWLEIAIWCMRTCACWLWYTGYVELCLPLRIPGVMSSGKPLRYSAAAVSVTDLCYLCWLHAQPLWRDLQTIDVTSWWREDWQSATVVNSTLVVDPTIWLTGFDLHRRQWSLLNRFRTGQGHCNACHKKWSFTDNELCDCGEIRTMSHIINSCPLTKFDGGLLR